MRLMRRKIIAIITLLCATVLCLSGCFANPEKYLPVSESGYFKYAIGTSSLGTQEAYLTGFTELGEEQTHIIIPSEIDGIPIVNFGYERSISMWKHQTVCDFKSDKTERLYVPFNTDRIWRNDAYPSYTCHNCSLVLWKDLGIGRYPCKNVIMGYELFLDYLDECKNTEYLYGYQGSSIYNLLANVSFMYNYDNAEDDGYYWVDSYDNGLIKFIPPEPAREGYTFGGWFIEPECITPWDFGKDKTKAEIEIKFKDIESYNIGDITFLYAKWIKNQEIYIV